jgi:hypothetical protein
VDAAFSEEIVEVTSFIDGQMFTHRESFLGALVLTCAVG